MSKLARRISPLFSLVFTHSRTRAARRWVAERRRRLRREPHRIRYFHQVDDPYSHLAAQVLGEVLERYDVELEPFLVGPPPDEAAPERERLEAFARGDAADVAPRYGLDFPETVDLPGEAAVELASRILAAAAKSGRFAEEAGLVGEAMWLNDLSQLEEISTRVSPASLDSTRGVTESGTALRHRLGHYLGAMFHYGGEWYWGVDRLSHLERRLQALGSLRPGKSSEPIAPRPHPSREGAIESSRRLQLECFLSLRSPYTAIAMERVLALPKRLPVDLILRPVLPMVMRGLPIPSSKRLYIVLDTKREADYCTWGQDRIWRVEEEIRRRLGTPGS